MAMSAAVKLLAAQVEPGSFKRNREGDLESKMRVLVAWEGWPDDAIDSEKLTWQGEFQFQGPTGVYRAYETTLLDPFISDVLNSADGNQRGWPFKRVQNKNDKFVWVHPSVDARLATRIRNDPSINQRTQYD